MYSHINCYHAFINNFEDVKQTNLMLPLMTLKKNELSLLKTPSSKIFKMYQKSFHVEMIL